MDTNPEVAFTVDPANRLNTVLLADILERNPVLVTRDDPSKEEKIVEFTLTTGALIVDIVMVLAVADVMKVLVAFRVVTLITDAVMVEPVKEV